MIQPPTGAHLSSRLRPPRGATPVSNLQSLCLAPPRAEPSSCAYGCLRREAYTHVLIARRAARPAQQIETSPSQMGVESQFFSLTAGCRPCELPRLCAAYACGCSGDPHVLRARSFVAAAGIEDDGLALAQ